MQKTRTNTNVTKINPVYSRFGIKSPNLKYEAQPEIICHTMLRATHSWKRCSCAGTISTRAILSHTITELSLLCIFVIRNLLRIFILLNALNHHLPLPVVYVKGSRELKLSQREGTLFSVNRSRLIWRVFIFDEQIAKTELKIFHINIHF